MPQTERKKWQILSEDLGWQHSILELRKFTLQVLAAYAQRNPEVANGGMSYWFGPYPEKQTTAWRNTHVRCRDVLITVHQTLRDLERVENKELIRDMIYRDDRNEQILRDIIREADRVTTG